jgi:hypothetical protein
MDDSHGDTVVDVAPGGSTLGSHFLITRVASADLKEPCPQSFAPNVNGYGPAPSESF